ncbi:hypothetical protein FOL47_003643 [Perkinsus chesapeaki]|uniref:Uncharacterized protein n=1 Tax=Perkinsus chesapeaki TaxID=330153 RepID=A0A7J6M845_PERCH|nr:hypothetical protein FOL47_003643 [Perkinsus chesapeaki]
MAMASMLDLILVTQVIVAGYGWPFPEGQYSGFKVNPYTYITVSFRYSNLSPTADIGVVCDKEPFIKSGYLRMRHETNDFIFFDPSSANYGEFIYTLNSICPNRFKMGDFLVFEFLPPGPRFVVHEEGRTITIGLR